MVTMVDEIFDRHYRDARSELNAGLARAFSRLGKAITNAFNVLNRIEYSAPWAPGKKTASRA